MSKFKVGDQRYYIPGYREPGLLAILCTVVEVKEGTEEGDVTFYWVDEPIGHALSEDELMTQDVAAEELMARYEENPEQGNSQLSDYREARKRFIAASHDNYPGFPSYKDKQPWEEWFNPQMVLDKRKGVIRAAAIRYKGKTYWTEAPGRHNHAMWKALEETGDTRCLDDEQGFILQDETFVDRIQAAEIALKAGQIEKLNWPPMLYSEDLW